MGRRGAGSRERPRAGLIMYNAPGRCTLKSLGIPAGTFNIQLGGRKFRIWYSGAPTADAATSSINGSTETEY